jgi:hypothetical protein
MATTYDPTKDLYGAFNTTPGSSGANSAAVAPSDTIDFTTYPKGLVVTAAGNLVVLPLKAADDGAHLITFTAAPVGFQPPFRVRRVMATGTTASTATITD